MRTSLVLAAVVWAGASAAGASVVTYDFTGQTRVGGIPHNFTGVFVYNNGVPGSTVYHPGGGYPVQRGFESRYQGATQWLSITLDNGESVSGGVGMIQNNNIQQANPGSQVPLGQSLQCYSSGVSGTINGLHVFNMYLAFLPVDPHFSWNALNTYFGGDAEAMLQNDPSILPPDIDPRLTGTALPRNVLDVFNGGVFLGTNHAMTNTVNDIYTFTRRVPSPSSLILLAMAPCAFTRRRR
ncbi:MAG: hypothetical protein KJZ65_12745 [Phycisphaerales bacterium]|nr:hypothetical protein [Phycisphaerales bacterium]